MEGDRHVSKQARGRARGTANRMQALTTGCWRPFRRLTRGLETLSAASGYATREGRLEAIIEQVGARLRQAPARAHNVHNAAGDQYANALDAENIISYTSQQPMELRGIEPRTS